MRNRAFVRLSKLALVVHAVSHPLRYFHCRTAYSISLSSGTGDLAALAKAVTAYKLGEGSGATHKEPSALLLTADAANTTLDVGSKAWDSFADMCDNPRGAPAVYFHHFMSALAPRSGAFARTACVPFAVAAPAHLIGCGWSSRDSSHRCHEAGFVYHVLPS